MVYNEVDVIHISSINKRVRLSFALKISDSTNEKAQKFLSEKFENYFYLINTLPVIIIFDDYF